ncbi:MAG: hypothetical protein US50_C0006G0018 [Candidatus Nomurabacteria bacterium GW2011_GWB1_37_5]|uniref:Cell division protein FtsX n=1 Tax=Candidatus Nomurabacteria bacterium GW2011_GWB1_37_5 TaxID=1618742 RepID=A0A0G0HB47_9BACT|nr:MAG: hypothetical protein US50_C0006G0018 [Candidatus Nomurabacteria bacterium GW2011_GWB1_37_5]
MNSLSRIIKSGWTNFTRNSVISIASVMVVTITLIVITSIILLQAVLFNSLNEIKNKVDVTIYFNVGAGEEKIMALKSAIEKIPEVESTDFISADEALVDFKERHANDYLVLQALDELDQNPLNAYLNVKAKEASQYEGIVKFLQSDNALARDSSTIIDKINYNQNKVIIDRLISIIDGAKKLGLIVTLLLVLISIIITFNTIRLTIFMAREEISIMRLVGASPKYVRGPFMMEGALYGIFSSLITVALFFPITLWFGNNMTSFLGLDLYKYYMHNFLQIAVIVLISGLILGVISSFFAVSKYLKK